MLTLRASLLTVLGAWHVAVGGYGFHFWMSDISQILGMLRGLNSLGFEGFLNFFGCVEYVLRTRWSGSFDR